MNKIYEQDLPEDISSNDYARWRRNSWLEDGMRVGFMWPEGFGGNPNKPMVAVPIIGHGMIASPGKLQPIQMITDSCSGPKIRLVKTNPKALSAEEVKQLHEDIEKFNLMADETKGVITPAPPKVV